jgi:hypothetical protein
MTKLLAAILSAVPILCLLASLFLGKGSQIPRAAANFGRIACLSAAAIPWILCLMKVAPGPGRTVLLLAFALLALVAVPIGLVDAISGSGILDRPGDAAPIAIGSPSAPRLVAIVYHKGGSGLALEAATALGEGLASKGCSALLLSARPGLRLKGGAYAAVVLCSPVYAGQARPPVLDFAAANAPFAMPVFALLSGGGATKEGEDLERLSATLALSGIALRGGLKVLSGDSGRVAAATGRLRDAVLASLQAPSGER